MDSSEAKELTRASYNLIADQYIARDIKVTAETETVLAALRRFANYFPPNAHILDIGFGGGRDARFFHDQGLRLTGIDFSEELLQRAQAMQPAITYLLMDFENLSFPPSSFDGVWANTSLHHITKKNLPAVLQSINTILKPQGILFLGIKHGQGERLITEDKFGPTIHRYFAFYEPEEISLLLEKAGFSVLSTEIASAGRWLDVFAQKITGDPHS